MKFKTFEDSRSQDLGGAMTDISFLLIIFFLVTAVFISEEGLFSSLPEADTTPQQENKNNVLRLHVSNNDDIKMNGTVFTDKAEAYEQIGILSERNARLVSFISVEGGVSYETVVSILSAVKKHGVANATLVSGTEADLEGFMFPLSLPDRVLSDGDSSGGTLSGESEI